MKTRLLAALLLTVAPAALLAAEKSPDPTAPAAVKRHPLRGVITTVLADKSSFMVKHEEIPGVMRAMTMMFQVDATALKTFKVGDPITALMSRQANAWVLEDVKPAAPKK